MWGLGEEYSRASHTPACGEAARTQVSWHKWDGFTTAPGPVLNALIKEVKNKAKRYKKNEVNQNNIGNININTLS